MHPDEAFFAITRPQYHTRGGGVLLATRMTILVCQKKDRSYDLWEKVSDHEILQIYSKYLKKIFACGADFQDGRKQGGGRFGYPLILE